MTIDLADFVAPGFEPVRDLFHDQLNGKGEAPVVGASLAVYRHGGLIVSLAGGARDLGGASAWTPDTLVNIWSATKGVTGIAIGVLVDRGLLDYAAPVARYWPQFAQNGKGEITLSQVLSHQAGLPGFAEPTALEDFYDWDLVTGRLAAQAPMWPPGTINSYHAMTVGFLAGEVVRRVTGISVGDFIAQALAEPLGIDLYVGLPEALEGRVAAILAPVDGAAFSLESAPLAVRAALTNPPMLPTLPNSRPWRAAQIPAGNGHATALALARLYGALANGGEIDGVTLMRPATIAAMTATQTTRVDLLQGFAPHWSHGFTGNPSGIYGPSPSAFGHPGWGGSFGSADPATGVAVGYAINQMADGIAGNPNASALCARIHDCLG
jgi:CubicO group peptidase (beta-lactamase class C family)